MPRSSKAPEPPPEPDINELVQNDVARIKRLLGLDVNRLALGSDVEGVIINGPFGNQDFTITGVNLIEFVNVSTSLGPAQGGSGFPAQVTGLSVTPQAGSNTQLNLTWTAITAPDFNYYNVYRGTATGFTVGESSRIIQPVTNSYNNIGLSPGTTYYYRVSTTNDAELEGSPSSEVSATTTSPPVTANLWLKFDGNYADSSTGGGNTVTSFNTSGFTGSGQFGGNSVKLNSPTAGTDHVEVTANTNINIDMAGKWSFSCWIYSTTTNGDFFSKFQSANNFANASVYFGDLRFRVTDAGTTVGKQTGVGGTSLTLNTWHHVVGTWDGTINAVNLYLDKILQTSSISSGINLDNANLMIGGHTSGGNRFDEFEGRVDEFQLFKGIVLTQGQVNNLFSTNAP